MDLLPASNDSKVCSSGLFSTSVASSSNVPEASISSSINHTAMEDKYSVFQDTKFLPRTFNNLSIIKMLEDKGINTSSELQNSSQEKNINGLYKNKSCNPVGFPNLVSFEKSCLDKNTSKETKTPPTQALKDVGAITYSGLNRVAFSNSRECLMFMDSNKHSQSQIFKDKDFSQFTANIMSPSKDIETKSKFFTECSENIPSQISFECKNPLNPFLHENFASIVPPKSPPPLPSSRQVTKLTEFSLLPPPIPSRVSRPLPSFLPEEKLSSLDSVQETLHFDLEAITQRPLADLQKDLKFFSQRSKWSPPDQEKLRSLSQPLSVLASKEESSNFYSDAGFDSFLVQIGESTRNPNAIDVCQLPTQSPILGTYQARQFCVKSNFIASSSDSGSSASPISESSSENRSSSSSELHTSDDSKFGSSSEALFSNSPSNQLDVFSQIRPTDYSASSGIATRNEELSPDSIFRRRIDPFDDEFFLNLRKNSAK